MTITSVNSVNSVSLDNLNQLYINPEYTNIFLCVAYPNDLVIKILTNSANNKNTKDGFNNKIYLMINLENNKFEKFNLTDEFVFYETIECKSLIDFIKTLLEKLNDYISDKESDIKTCNKYIQQYENYKDIIINGKYDDSLKIKFNLEEKIDNIIKDDFKIQNIRTYVYLNKSQRTYQFDDSIEINKDIFDILKAGYIKEANFQISEYNKMFPTQRYKISKYKNILEILKLKYSEIFI